VLHCVGYINILAVGFSQSVILMLNAGKVLVVHVNVNDNVQYAVVM
jgi:hypothetical protein